MNINCIAIIGLGLIGSSIARASKTKIGIQTILAYDSDENYIKSAISDGIVTKTINKDNIKKAEIIFVCTPVSYTVSEIKKWLPYINPNCIITDVGSTKSGITSEIERLTEQFIFVGGHPMTGSEKSGYFAGKSHLFENAYYLVIPTSKSNKEHIDIICEYAKLMGAIPLTIKIAEHDKIMAAVSHLPHVIASALVNFLSDFDKDGLATTLAAGGFRDTTRVASSSPVMWENICMSNSDMISNSIDNFIEILEGIKKSLTVKERESIYNYFNSAKSYRDKMATGVRGEFDPYFDIVVDVEDKPGIIGQVATVLGLSEINIKNMNISNSREFENGVLTVSLSSKEEQQKSYNILKQFNFRVELKS